jgi:peroxiredoxin
MARTPSAMVELGSQAADFRLPDVVTGRTVTRDQVARPKGMLAMFICRHCPFVKHVQGELAKLGRDYQRSGVGIVAISANDESAFPEDGPEKLAEMSRELGFTFPYLFDQSQEVARAYDAQCTPDFFLYDSKGKLVYRGQLDDSRPGNEIPVTGKDLRAALDALVAGKPISPNQRPSIGCNIKWHSTVPGS